MWWRGGELFVHALFEQQRGQQVELPVDDHDADLYRR
jgi:hypothetical protein